MSIESVENQDDSPSEKKLNFWQKLKNFYKEYKPYLISHHPNCDKYEEHVFKIRGKKFCIGCFIGYPTAVRAEGGGA